MGILEKVGLTKFDIDKIVNLDDIFNDCPEKTCIQYHIFLEQKAKECSNEQEKKVITFISIICSFGYDSEDQIEPFKPGYVFENRRSMIPKDMDDNDIELLKKISRNISNVEVNARINDVIWVQTKDFNSANKAINNYIESAKILIDSEFWTNSFERLKRALKLSTLINNNNTKNDIINLCLEIMGKENMIKTWFPFKIAEMLSEQKEINKYFDEVIDKCIKSIEFLKVEENFHMLSEYYDLMARLFHNNKIFDKEAEYLLSLAENEILQAERSLQGSSKGNLNVIIHYQKAVEILKTFPEEKERYNNTHNKLLEYQKKYPLSMQTHEYKQDISSLIDHYNKIFDKLDFSNSVIKFSKVFLSPTKEQIDNHVKMNQKHIFSRIFESVLIDKAGKTIGKKASQSINSTVSDKERKQIAFEFFHIHWNISVSSLVKIFLSHISEKTIFNKDDIRELVYRNPVIPKGREEIYVEGLYAGFKYDFLSALHLLLPQVENTFRFILRSRGIVTSKIINGIQEDYDINELVNIDSLRKELEKIFTEDIILDIEGLAIGRYGANLRNRMAHGLLSRDECYGIEVVYFWAMMLKLCVFGWTFMKELESKEEQKD